MRKRIVEGPANYELTPEMDEKITAMTEEAARDVEEVRVNMRWRRAQVDIIKRAAAHFGLPYQTYIKQAAFRQALADLRTSEGVAPGRKRRRG